jgi:hypothetical protein
VPFCSDVCNQKRINGGNEEEEEEEVGKGN